MHLYSLTLQRAQSITQAVYGSFTEAKAHELVVVRGGKVLELLKVGDNYKLQTVVSTEVFGVIRSVSPFRLTGSATDYVVVGSDSGRLAILQYNAATQSFQKVHMETFGKSGCRRIVPGQHIAVDPSGRACMVAALEKQKFVYVLNRDAAAQLTISSPLECHRSHTLVFHVVGLDVGFENPVFAALEVEYEDEEDAGEEPEKMLVFYELDLGLNHVVRRWSDPIGLNANLLFAVPGGNDGPGGVLVCCDNLVIYKNQGSDDKIALLPRRKGMADDHPLCVVSGCVVRRKGAGARAGFFFLLQSELGDLYEVTLEVFDDEVRDVAISYFDTLAVASSLCVMRLGFLFVASEFGNHSLYQFNPNAAQVKDDVEVVELESGARLVRFEPQRVRRLIPIEKLESASPIIDMQVSDLCNEGYSQVYALCGRGHGSSLRVLRHGVPVTEEAESLLPSLANGVWTLKKTALDPMHSYIVVSFAQGTIVLSIEGGAVEEVKDLGFVSDNKTLSASLLGDDALLQVHPNGIRHVRHGRKHDWKPAGKAEITHAAANAKQVAIALTGGLVHFFELDEASQLLEVGKTNISSDVTALDIVPVVEGSARARFLTIGTGDTVRIYSLDPETPLVPLAIQKLPDVAHSLCLVHMDDSNAGVGEQLSGQSTLYLNIGLANGVVLRTVMDTTSGNLSDTRTRYLGNQAVRVERVVVGGEAAVMALSSRAWCCYAFQRRFHMTPLSCPPIEYVAPLNSDQFTDGMVAISQNVMRIFTIDRLGDSFNQTIVPLRHTPRRSVVHPHHNTLVILESDHREYPESVRKRMALEAKAAKQNEGDEEMEVEGANGANGGVVKQEDMQDEGEGEGKQAKEGNEDGEGEGEGEGEDDDEDEEENNVAPIPAPPGQWASCVRLVDPALLNGESSQYVLDLVELESGEAAVSMCVCSFAQRNDEVLLVVGTALDYQLAPRSCSGGRVHVFRFDEGGRKLVLEHSTPTDEAPMAMAGFQGRLLCGVGNVLRLYDIGKRRMLRKAENKTFPNLITRLHVVDNRIVVGDVAESFHFCRYRADTNTIHVFADDTFPRWLSASCMLDYDTAAGADKFGNFFVSTLPSDISDIVEDDPTGLRVNWFNHGFLNGAPNKLDNLINYHVGDLVTCMHKGVLVAGGDEAVVCSTLSGAIMAFLPITSRSEVEFLSSLEMHLRQDHPPLCGRDHLAFRSAYMPVKGVVDGDLCEQFSSLPFDKQRDIAQALDDRSPGEVIKKLEDMRNHLL